MKHDIRPGARVAYSAKFLRSIGCQTGPMPFARGRVIVMRHYAGATVATVATVAWNDPAMPAGVNVANLISVDSIGLECVE
jgi:hypothetical protein